MMNGPTLGKTLWHQCDRDGVRLSCADFGGDGAAVMLLHGLAGGADEWLDTASRLAARHRVLAPDQRGHGRSERRPPDVSRDAYVDDVAMWVDRLNVAPVVVVGQSLGGHTAFLLAARRPDLVRALVVVEATPEANSAGRDEVKRWLETWPVPFASPLDAVQFLGGDTAWAQAWARSLEVREDGLWPRFDLDIMVASLTETSERSYWDEWSRVMCRTLIVKGEYGLAPDELDRMLELVPTAQLVEIPGAGHDAHLDRPDEWQICLDAFLEEVR